MRMIKVIVVGFIVYLFSAVFSYSVFSNNIIPLNKQNPAVTVNNNSNNGEPVDPEDDGLPKTEQCPMNGVMYSTKQKEWWEAHRPLGVMIENHEDARPQSGLSYADVIYEAIAEGGITRFLSVFYCRDAGFVGPVRSARTYFLDFISEYGDYPLYAHVGGANTDGPADALGQIQRYSWKGYNDLDQFAIGFPVYARYEDRLGHPTAVEHTTYSKTSKLWEYAANKRDLTNVDEDGKSWNTSFREYKFKDDISSSERPESQIISFDFWTGYKDYSVKWEYDKATNSYLRWNGGEKHTDLNNKKQLSAKTVAILFMRESRANDGYEGNLHMIYGTKGTGSATVFMDGEEIDATWTKRDRTSRLILKDSNGREIEFSRGRIWFEIVSPDTDIEVN